MTATATAPRKSRKSKSRTGRMALLRFGKGNGKLSESIATFSLPAGWTCPGASQCLSRAVINENGKARIQDGPHTRFRCFSASQEAQYDGVRHQRNHNLALLKGAKTAAGMARLILASLPKGARIVRIHVSGDFFSKAYFDAWLMVVRQRPEVTFYAYTKSLPLWIARKDEVPANLVLTASMGGRYDRLAAEHGLRTATVVFSEAGAEALGLEIDHDDSLAMRQGPSFALLLHGIQPPGSEASRALQALRNAGEFGYGPKADSRRVALPTV